MESCMQRKMNPIRNGWYYAFLITVTLLMLYPVCVLAAGLDSWMNAYLVGCPFTIETVIALLWLKQALSTLGNPWLVLVLVYYSWWALCILSAVLAMRVHKAWRNLAYGLLCVDMLCNLLLLSLRFPAIIVDIALIVLLVLAVKKQFGRPEEIGLPLEGKLERL